MVTSMPVRGPWSIGEIEAYLFASVLPLRLSCVGGDGYPRVVSVWYRYLDGHLCCVAHQKSSLVALLSGNEKVGFELAPNEPPYCGVRGQGTAVVSRLDADNDTLDRLLERYVGGADSQLAKWLLARREEEMLIRVKPARWFSWDYRDRMADIASAPDR